MFRLQTPLALLLLLFTSATIAERLLPRYNPVKPNSPWVAPVRTLHSRQVQCPADKGTCHDGCCLYSQGCCFDGCSSYAPNIGVCCENGGSCGPGELCCGDAGCIPEGARCCADGGYCDAGHECSKEPDGSMFCCPNGQCDVSTEQLTGTPTGSPGPYASSPRTSHADPISSGVKNSQPSQTLPMTASFSTSNGTETTTSSESTSTGTSPSPAPTSTSTPAPPGPASTAMGGASSDQKIGGAVALIGAFGLAMGLL